MNTIIFKNFKINLYFEIFLVSICSYIVLVLAYPDYFVFAKIRFNSGTDIVHPFMSAFINAKALSSFDFDLWNIYDQVNYSFSHLTSGIYTLPSLMEAIIFLLLNPFFENQSILIHNIHSYFFQYFCIFTRSIGLVLILRFYNTDLKYRILISVVFNTIFSSAITAGIMIAFIYSIVPILIYFIILLFYEKKIEHLISFILLIAFCFAQAPSFTLSYLFLPFHFIFFIFIVKIILNFIKNPKLIKNKINSFFKISSKKIVFLSFFPLLFIASFNIIFFIIMNETIVLTELNAIEGSRLDNIFNTVKYYQSYNADHLNLTFYKDFINFKNFNLPEFGTYTGLISLIIIFLGTFNSNKNERWIFFGTVIYIILLLGPRSPINILHPSFYAHLINSLFNPFSFLTRDPHMTNQFMYFFLIPNFIFGINFLQEFSKNIKLLKISFDQLFFFFVLLLSFMLLNYQDIQILLYIFISILLFFLIFYISKKSFSNFNDNKKSLIIFFILVCGYVYEIFNLKIYYDYMPFTGSRIYERQLNFINPNDPKDVFFKNKTLMSGETIEIREVLGKKVSVSNKIIDYQNPVSPIFPTTIIVNTPEIPKILPISLQPHQYRIADLYFDPATFYGNFFKNIFLNRVLNSRQIYELRHQSYLNIKEKNNLYKNVNTIELMKFDLNKNVYNNFDTKKIKKQINIIGQDINLYKKTENYSIYKINSSQIIPGYLNTNVFDLDNNFEIKIDEIYLDKVQGFINTAYQFDVNNIRSGYTFFSLPNNEEPQNINFYYYELSFIKKIDVSKSNYLFNISSLEDDLYLILRFPYDKNWAIKNNNKIINYSSYENMWISIKLDKGINNLELKYDLNKYFINNLTIFFYFISQLSFLIILFLMNKKSKITYKKY